MLQLFIAFFPQGPDGKIQYLAAQGPLPRTVDDFWRLLWSHKIQVQLCTFSWSWNFNQGPKKLVLETLSSEDGDADDGGKEQ